MAFKNVAVSFTEATNALHEGFAVGHESLGNKRVIRSPRTIMLADKFSKNLKGAIDDKFIMPAILYVVGGAEIVQHAESLDLVLDTQEGWYALVDDAIEEIPFLNPERSFAPTSAVAKAEEPEVKGVAAFLVQ